MYYFVQPAVMKVRVGIWNFAEVRVRVNAIFGVYFTPAAQPLSFAWARPSPQLTGTKNRAKNRTKNRSARIWALLMMSIIDVS